MRLLVRLIKYLSNSYQRRVDGTHSAQLAYQILQRGLRQWQEDRILLSARELSSIQACRNRLILSAAERELVERSEEAASKKWLRNARLGLGMLAAILLVSTGAFAVYYDFFGGREQKAVVAKAAENNLASISSIRVNQPPRKASTGEPASAEVVTPKAVPPPVDMEQAPLSKSARKENRVSESAVAGRLPEEKEVAATLEKPRSGEIRIRRKGNRTGLADASGRFLLAPEYDDVQLFDRRRGLFKIVKDGKEGLALTDGELLLHPFFEEVVEYIEEERTVIVNNEGKYSLYDEQERQFASGFEFLKICCYSEGLFGVQRDNGRWGFIDGSGKAAILSMYEGIEKPFRDGRATVVKDGQKVEIDRNGNVFPL